MTKKFNIFDNTNLQDVESWGNVELPGLTDEELHSKNWEQSARTQAMMQTESWKRSQQKMLQKRIDTGFYQQLGKRNKTNLERKEKLKQAGLLRRGQGNPSREKPCICEGVEYKSMSEASRAYGITKKSMKDRATHNPDAFYFKDEGPKPVYVWCYITPKGNYFSSSQMEQELGISVYKIKDMILKNAQGYDYKLMPRPLWNMNKVSIWRKGKERYERLTDE